MSRLTSASPDGNRALWRVCRAGSFQGVRRLSDRSLMLASCGGTECIAAIRA